jgi:CheY-like chemotaxis protein
LGLTTAYGVVRAHRGFINVYSERGHGTTFSIYLPASDERKKERAEVRETIPRGSETVLVVDDELPVLDVAADILTYLGYRVFKAASGEEAIRIYRDKSGEIDLVLLDMIMPRMNGKEVFLKLKEINPSVCVCITSGYTQTPQAQEIIDLGVRGFIYKPYTIRDLAHRMREILA